MDPETSDQIREAVLRSLQETRYATTSLVPLSGGVANLLYRARLATPLEDGTTEVIVKHAEAYVAAHPNTELPLSRCVRPPTWAPVCVLDGANLPAEQKVEEECLRSLADFRVTGVQDSVKYIVRTPKCYFHDEKSNTQILEYLPNGIDLKNYVLHNFASPTPASYRPQFLQLGKAVARWIGGFHKRADREARDALNRGEKSKLYAELEDCESMQKLKFLINYDWLLRRVNDFPDILEEAREVFEDHRASVREELKGDVMPIHGDFWTGNVVISNVPIQDGAEIPLFIIDWEMAQLGVPSSDLGQMLAEMYAIWLYRKIDAGLWMVQGFAEGLELKDQKMASSVAAQVGCHLVAFDSNVPGWGTTEQQRECARVGRDFIVHARKFDRDWFDQSELACLFAQVG